MTPPKQVNSLGFTGQVTQMPNGKIGRNFNYIISSVGDNGIISNEQHTGVLPTELEFSPSDMMAAAEIANGNL